MVNKNTVIPRQPLSRSEVMSRVKGKNTSPEIRVRRELHRFGVRFRLHRADLPGKPDIVLPGRRCVIFVHGCFWHRHPGCRATRTPKSHIEFWERKFTDNVERDVRAQTALENAGWRVIVVWECETKSAGSLRCFASLVKALPVVHSPVKIFL